jgi:hypothetical protein
MKLPVTVKMPRVPEFGDAHERGSQRAEHVAECDALRHRRHRHELAQRVADDRSDDQASDDPLVGQNVLMHQCADDRQQHANGSHLHTALRLIGLGQTSQAEDEQDRRCEIAALHEQFTHAWIPLLIPSSSRRA